ncbi:Mbeg1-like protein [Mogibacterium pumilum]|uniref:DUF2974 domain-containing protein n=1 Tax=Mogibacterium pumilum TaxID=86332 RepID=A0A223ASJ9_9FIRM|nr:Mbeg1-like protein [Mogibacterium pumilum]ASS37936.1 hypothetical protein AXF17_05485 [Mogibacterium pumilum]
MVLLDYLKWRNDVSLKVAPFNDIDNVILSCLAYIDFGEFFNNSNDYYTIEEIFEIFCKNHSLDEIRESKQFTERVALLLEEMVQADRFKGTKIVYYAEDLDKEKVKQFAAITFVLPDGTNYISFRGTDSTITGWKEDFLMTFMADTEGAKEAVKYINEVSRLLEGNLIVGGHSKGGNFAMFASAFCDKAVQERISRVYNNDGPGFRDEVIESIEYQAIVQKICTIVPQTSMIGQLLANESEQKVIESDAIGLYQHDAMTWKVTKDSFINAELDAFGNFVDVALGSWLEKIDDETRLSVVSTVFSMIEETEAETFYEFSDSLFKNTGIIIKGLVKLPKEKRTELMNALGSLVKVSSKTALNSISRPTEKLRIVKEK